MLNLTVYDRGQEVVLKFEHSLLALSKWEAKYRIPFMTLREKSPAQLIDYYQAMLVSPEDSPELVFRISPAQMDELLNYMNTSATASIAPISTDDKKSNEIMTSDTLYMQMVLLRIPFEAQTWHLSRLSMLIAKAAHAQAPKKKERPGNLLNRWAEINKANRERFNSKG